MNGVNAMIKNVTITCTACDRDGMTGSEQGAMVRCFECGGRHRWEEKVDISYYPMFDTMYGECSLNCVRAAGNSYEEVLEAMQELALPEFEMGWEL